MVMDYLRSCYRTTMVFRIGDAPVEVTWKWAKEGAQRFPGDHSFGSTNWVERVSDAGDLGEQPGDKPWSNGSGVHGDGASLGTCTDANMFISGIPDGELAPEVDSEGWPLCCSAEPPFDCLALSDTLTLTLAGTSDCSNIDQAVTLTRIPGLCVWVGAAGTWLGTAGIAVTYTEPDWFLAIDCFAAGPTITFVSASYDPLLVIWEVLDTGACCSFAESTFTATLN